MPSDLAAAPRGQPAVRVEQQPFQRGNGALLGHGAAGDGDGALQKGFFTGEFHACTSSLVGV